MAQPLQGHKVPPPRPPVHPPPHIARPSSKDKRSTTAEEKVEYYLSSQQQQLQPHSVPPSYVSTEAATTTTSFAQLQHCHLPQDPDPQVGEVSITMPMDELPTASSKVKTKQGRCKDDDIESSDSESDAPTVQHFNVSFLFKKTFREHKGANAVNCAYVKLRCLYECTLKVTYNCCLLIFGFLLACIWGICNGVVAFLQAWIISPLLRVSLIVVKGIMPIILDPLSLLMKAYVDACRGPGGGLMAGLMQSVGGAVSGR